jgi:hypothetical protein
MVVSSRTCFARGGINDGEVLKAGLLQKKKKKKKKKKQMPP